MPQDYILRLLQQLGAIVATIAGRRTAGDLQGAEQAIADECLRQTGLPFVVVQQSSPENLAALLQMGGARQVSRALTLAELLREDALLAEQRGNPLHAAVSYRQALSLVTSTLPGLRGEEETLFRGRAAELAVKLRDLTGE